MIRYRNLPPGGEGIVSSIIRVWWMLISNYYTYRWLLAQLILSHQRFLLPRNEKRSGETVVITGGSRGIGAAVVKHLLRSDMHVIIGCRNTQEANNTVKNIRRKGITTGTVETLALDLTSLNSIREFAYKILRKDLNISVLINNAGVKGIPYGVTVEGLEHNFQVNYLGHVFLTYLLLPKLHNSSIPDKLSRVVNLSSVAHYGAYPDLTDLQMKKFYSSEKSHMDSMLLKITLTNFLDKQLQDVGVRVRLYSVHPGFVNTELWDRVRWISKLGIFKQLLFRSAEQAAESITYVALSPDLEGTGGQFINNNEVLQPHPLTIDHKFQKRLWHISSHFLQIQDNFLSTKESKNKTDSDCDNGNHEYLSSTTDENSSLEFPQSLESLGNDDESEENSFIQPYYEYFISNIFKNLNLNKSWIGYLEIISIFILHRLHKFNSQFKLIQTYE